MYSVFQNKDYFFVFLRVETNTRANWMILSVCFYQEKIFPSSFPPDTFLSFILAVIYLDLEL